MSKRQRRALSTGSSLTDVFQSMQFFNPEFDPATEEAEPAPIRSILHERFLEALDASIYEDTNEIVLVLDKVMGIVILQIIAWIANDQPINLQQVRAQEVWHISNSSLSFTSLTCSRFIQRNAMPILRVKLYM